MMFRDLQEYRGTKDSDIQDEGSKEWFTKNISLTGAERQKIEDNDPE